MSNLSCHSRKCLRSVSLWHELCLKPCWSFAKFTSPLQEWRQRPIGRVYIGLLIVTLLSTGIRATSSFKRLMEAKKTPRDHSLFFLYPACSWAGSSCMFRLWCGWVYHWLWENAGQNLVLQVLCRQSGICLLLDVSRKAVMVLLLIGYGIWEKG